MSRVKPNFCEVASFVYLPRQSENSSSRLCSCGCNLSQKLHYYGGDRCARITAEVSLQRITGLAKLRNFWKSSKFLMARMGLRQPCAALRTLSFDRRCPRAHNEGLYSLALCFYEVLKIGATTSARNSLEIVTACAVLTVSSG